MYQNFQERIMSLFKRLMWMAITMVIAMTAYLLLLPVTLLLVAASGWRGWRGWWPGIRLQCRLKANSGGRALAVRYFRRIVFGCSIALGGPGSKDCK